MTIAKTILSKTLNHFAYFIILFHLFSPIVEAQIIYTDIKPDTIIPQTKNTSANYYLDINNDATADFELRYNYFGGGSFGKQLEFYTKGGQAGEIMTNGSGAPLALNVNSDVNSAQVQWVCTFSGCCNNALDMLFNTIDFIGKADRYIGLRIKLNSKWHYGWVRINIPSDTSKIIIKDYAYESASDIGIKSGATGLSAVAPTMIENNIVQIFPNPFRAQANVVFDLTEKANVKLTVYNTIGQEIMVMENRLLQAGNYEYKLNIEDKGIYFFQYLIDDFMSTQRLFRIE